MAKTVFFIDLKHFSGLRIYRPLISGNFIRLLSEKFMNCPSFLFRQLLSIPFVPLRRRFVSFTKHFVQDRFSKRTRSVSRKLFSVPVTSCLLNFIERYLFSSSFISFISLIYVYTVSDFVLNHLRSF